MTTFLLSPFSLLMVVLVAPGSPPRGDSPPQEHTRPPRFFRGEEVRFWKEKKTTTPSDPLWSEPIFLPDGRNLSYTPPPIVLKLLQKPDKENARRYLVWQRERLKRLQGAADALQAVREEEDTSWKVTYFRQDHCPLCPTQDAILKAVAQQHPGLTISAITPAQNQELWSKYQIMTTPSLLFEREGQATLLRGFASEIRIEEILDGRP